VEAIAEAIQRPTMKFVATKTAEQLNLQALHRVRERLVSQRSSPRRLEGVALIG
jgi:transposase